MVEKKSEKKVERPAEKVEDSRSNAKVEKRETSVKSEDIASPMVKSKQMKRTSGRNETTIRGSQRLVKEEVVEKKVHVDSDSWTNHLKLVAFTIVGLVMIYIVMHPNSKV